MRRAMRGLARYASVMRRLRVERVEAVATSAVRDASNGRAFVRRVRARFGIPLRVISGREEARLAYLGVLQAQRTSQPIVIVTIGGGSAQVVQGEGLRLRYAASVPLGGARLSQRFIRHDPPAPEDVEALRRAVRRGWRPVVRGLRGHRWRQALGSSATIYQLMMASHLRRYRRLPASKDRLAISQRSLRELVAWLSVSTAAERTHLPGLDPKRQDLALPTAIALLAWMEGCGVSALAYAPGSIREGLAVDYLLRHHQGRTRRIPHPLEALFGANGSRGSARSRVRRRVVRRVHPVWSVP
jgi:exopolyphosphatase/guanosine-5'-triphosphate,3'-diphosphate pyrophosphatase